MPQWEHINTNFDTDYTDSKKSESANILAIQVGENLIKNYPKHIKKNLVVLFWVSYSVKQDSPFLIQKCKNLFSIFSSELRAILTALNYICNIQLAIYNFLFCVDSKSFLYACVSM